ncbi:hypothetical protein EON63_21640 [archaeon]|nr:MAG: hypothetical protein EON63_21640 [archaeon]
MTFLRAYTSEERKWVNAYAILRYIPKPYHTIPCHAIPCHTMLYMCLWCMGSIHTHTLAYS